MIRHSCPLLRYIHSLQQLEEQRRKSFLPQACPENAHILKGVTFDNGVLQKKGWGSLTCQGFMITKDYICFGLKAQQFSGLCPPKRHMWRLAANCSYSHHYPGDCISCSHHSMQNCQSNALEQQLWGPGSHDFVKLCTAESKSLIVWRWKGGETHSGHLSHFQTWPPTHVFLWGRPCLEQILLG